MTINGNTIDCVNSIHLLSTLRNIYLNIFDMIISSNHIHFIFRFNHSLMCKCGCWCCVRASLLIAFGECVDDNKFHLAIHIHFGTENAVQTLFMIYEPNTFQSGSIFFLFLTPDTISCILYALYRIQIKFNKRTEALPTANIRNESHRMLHENDINHFRWQSLAQVFIVNLFTFDGNSKNVQDNYQYENITLP